MIGQVLLEGFGLGVLLMLVCAFGIRSGAVGMVHLYHEPLQARCVALGLTTREKIRKNQKVFKLVCIPGYLAYVLVFCLPCSSRHLLSYRSGLVPRSAVSATRSLRRA